MHGCWAYDPVQRPGFSTLVNTVGEILAQDAQYFVMAPTSISAPLILEDANEGGKESRMELNFCNLQALEVNSDREKDAL